jgi:hypothetical protein
MMRTPLIAILLSGVGTTVCAQSANERIKGLESCFELARTADAVCSNPANDAARRLNCLQKARDAQLDCLKYVALQPSAGPAPSEKAGAPDVPNGAASPELPTIPPDHSAAAVLPNKPAAAASSDTAATTVSTDKPAAAASSDTPATTASPEEPAAAASSDTPAAAASPDKPAEAASSDTPAAAASPDKPAAASSDAAATVAPPDKPAAGPADQPAAAASMGQPAAPADKPTGAVSSDKPAVSPEKSTAPTRPSKIVDLPPKPPVTRWVISETTSPVDFTAMITAAIRVPVGIRHAPDTFAIRCRGKGTELLVRTGGTWRTSRADEVQVEYQINDHPPVRLPWTISVDGRTASYKEDSIKLLELLLDGSQLKINVFDGTAPRLETTFPLAGLDVVREKMAAICKWPPIANKASSETH